MGLRSEPQAGATPSLPAALCCKGAGAKRLGGAFGFLALHYGEGSDC